MARGGPCAVDLAMLALPATLAALTLRDLTPARLGRSVHLLSVCALYSGLLVAISAGASAWVIPLTTASGRSARRRDSRAAHDTFRLGRVDLEAGRPHAALGLFAEAKRLDPAVAPAVEPWLRKVRVRNPRLPGGALIAPPAGAPPSPVPEPRPDRSERKRRCP